MDKTSGVGVLDKAVKVLAALEQGPASLATLVTRTDLARPTAHRLAVALEVHGLVARDTEGRFTLGSRIGTLARALGPGDPLLAAAPGVLARLRDRSGESAQLYRREGDMRRCVAAAERATGLRDSVPVGALLPMSAGSAAQVLLAWQPIEQEERLVRQAKYTAAALIATRKRGWAASVGERESGLASVSAPVFGPDGAVIAAISVSGPISRVSRTPGRMYAAEVVAAAEALTRAVAAFTARAQGGAPPSGRNVVD